MNIVSIYIRCLDIRESSRRDEVSYFGMKARTINDGCPHKELTAMGNLFDLVKSFFHEPPKSDRDVSGADADAKSKESSGQTPLKRSVDEDADVYAKDCAGMTALMHCRNAEMAKLLIEAGADVNARDKGGMTALKLINDDEIKKVLKAAGGN